ncbi:SpoIIE family protein phosphatase [Frankia sp. CNm7]|uniref:SpoIIE family protein phosphatase n=1 Tax=Frankia nepalensis TaxID=1836974 RepID=A0A937REC3_9ACTN|nr:SpoIIE family protein phosphatase [Frankia nepalensis]MBL7498845.1 SpoIIE family protein phosphatase [Frankia nepalensis]MBL7508650.1 SpoIIE family protein phosphatase [Frankia nepalensis]MBL7521049.1 SpoIIE family protein phosphatase [Frankia nepalensis]MBL7628437.1 SpoIIE family protein phosphatase [Frankia nepalensis]
MRSVVELPAQVAAKPDETDWPVLLVEDDDGDAFLVQELLEETSAPVQLLRASSIAEARALADGARAVLLDLGLPDSHGLSALETMRRLAPRAAIVVLTGLADEHRGIEALAAGAQDYLVKGEIDGKTLVRALRYALERRDAEHSAQALRESQLRAEENARLERGLLPTPLLRDTRLGHLARYRPGRSQALLGGDFYDVVETPDNVVHVLLGDVCGHGPDEAALGASLRIAWRTLVLAGIPEPDRLAYLQDVLVSERTNDELFATVCTLTVAPDRASVSMRLAGHPPPAMIHPTLAALPDTAVSPALGVLDDLASEQITIPLPAGWELLLATDGLLEGRDGPDGERLGWDGVLAEIASISPPPRDDTLPDTLIDRVERRNGGPLTDDVALLLLRGPTT